MTELTPFGKALRHLRVDLDITLKDMAKDLEMKPSVLSGIEHGRKAVPDDLIDQIHAEYPDVSHECTAKLQEAALSAVTKVEIDLTTLNPPWRKLAVSFSKHLKNLGVADMETVQTILNLKES